MEPPRHEVAHPNSIGFHKKIMCKLPLCGSLPGRQGRFEPMFFWVNSYQALNNCYLFPALCWDLHFWALIGGCLPCRTTGRNRCDKVVNNTIIHAIPMAIGMNYLCRHLPVRQGRQGVKNRRYMYIFWVNSYPKRIIQVRLG